MITFPGFLLIQQKEPGIENHRNGVLILTLLLNIIWFCVSQLTSLSFIFLIWKMGTIIPRLTSFRSFSQAPSMSNWKVLCTGKAFLRRKYSKQRTSRGVLLKPEPRGVPPILSHSRCLHWAEGSHTPVSQQLFMPQVSNLETSRVIKLKLTF